MACSRHLYKIAYQLGLRFRYQRQDLLQDSNQKTCSTITEVQVVGCTGYSVASSKSMYVVVTTYVVSTVLNSQDSSFKTVL